MGDPLTKPQTLIQIFAKDPQTPAVKTRLQPMLGRVGAQQLYQQLCLQTLEMVAQSDHDIELWTVSAKQRPFFRYCQQQFACRLRQQRGQDLGQRMQAALIQGLRQYRQVILIGTDCPNLSLKHLQVVAQSLAASPVVIIPAQDGGYVLIAMQKYCAPIFNLMPWSQANLYQKTQRRLRRLRIRYAAQNALSDLDTPLDYLKIYTKTLA